MDAYFLKKKEEPSKVLIKKNTALAFVNIKSTHFGANNLRIAIYVILAVIY